MNEKTLTENDIKNLLQELKRKRDAFYEEKSAFEKEKKAFELYKQEEEIKLKETLLKKSIENEKKLQQEKIEFLDNLRKSAQKELEEMYKKLEEEKKEVNKKMLQILEFEKEKRDFETTKNEMLKAYEEELNSKKSEILSEFHIKQTEKLKDIIKQQEKMFEDRKNELKEKEKSLDIKEGELNQKEAMLKIREEDLEMQRDEIARKEKEKVEEELEYLKDKILNKEEVISMLKSEQEKLKDELDKYSIFENIDEVYEKINDLEFKLNKEKEKFETVLKEKEDTIIALENELDKLRKDYQQVIEKNESMQNENMQIVILRNENEQLKYDKESLEHKVKVLKGELEIEKEKLESIFSEGKELELRAKEIIDNPYFEEISNEPLEITDEFDYLNYIEKNIKNYGVEYPKRLLYAFHTALKCADFSPLTVLYGVSGTGKSELPKLYSYFGGFNFLSEAVQPTWDSPESMIGYFNTIENKFDATNITKFLFQTFLDEDTNPYSLYSQMNMILLDEMNLAHIELYFAEFLSKFEQRRGLKEVLLDIKLGTNKIYNLPLRRNLLWIGTMNDDETTKSLSDKVLDRSYLINFPRPKELYSRKHIKKLDRKDFKYLPKNIWESWIVKENLSEDLVSKFKNITNQINQILMPTGRAIGHRVWQSMEFYMQNHPLVSEYKSNSNIEDVIKSAYEEQLVQKIMPKLRGIEVYGKEKDILNNIKNVLIEHKLDIVEDFESAMDNPYGQFIWNSANYIFKDIDAN